MKRYLRTAPFHPALENAFCEVVGALRAGDSLNPIHVLVPTHVLGRHLMRTVARRSGVCFNVRFLTFPDLAELVACERLAASGRAALPPLGDFLIARKAIKARVPANGYLAPIRESPGTPRAVLSSVTDLKKAGVTADQLEAFAADHGSKKLEELAQIYREIEFLQVEAGCFDWSERLAMASLAARSSAALAGSLAICLYGFAELNTLEQRFLEACVEGRSGYVFMPDDVAGHTLPLTAWLAAQGFAPEPDTGGGAVSGPAALAREVFHEPSGPDEAVGRRPVTCEVKIISAPGVAQEIQEVARQILVYAARPGASFSDVGVLLRQPAAYERTIRDVFESAGIPYVFLDGRLLRDTLAGRLLRLLVRIRRSQYPRAEVMEFLGLAPLRSSMLRADPDASPADWDRYSREAGIVTGREHWRRIPALRRRLEWRKKRLVDEAAGAQDPARRRQVERDLRSVQAFEYVMNVLLKRCEAIPDRGTIGALMAGLLHALQTVASLDAGDQNAVQALASVARTRMADEEVTFETFAGLLEDMLDERSPPADVYRTGRVIVSSLGGALGLPFQLVLIPGLVERSFPAPARQDPILLDAERDALNARYGTALAQRVHRAAEERFTFSHALGAAAARLIFSFPRLDAATGQVRVASHYLLRVAEALTGRPARYETLGTLTDRISLGRVAGDGEALRPADWDLARVSRAVASRDPQVLRGLPGLPALVRGTLAEDRRWGRRTFTEYDGVLGAAVPPPPTLAATQLETYGLCPFKFFGERILGVREIEEPEAVETITPLDRGALLHDILDRFFSQLVQDGLVPVRAEALDECRRRLRTIADEVCTGFEKSGAVGYRFMWEVEKARILTDLEGVLSFELAEPPGFVPAYFEARFGPTPAWVTPPPGSMPRPLELPVDGRPMRFTGYIDRIDLNQRGGARVIDYKTGMIYGEKSDQFRGGQSLQLPLYIRAADAMLAHYGIAARTSEAFYYYATGKGGYKRVGFSRQTLETRSGEFTLILKTIADGIAAGVFPQRPGKNGDHCTYCSFQPVCGHGRVRLVERKQRDPAIAALTAMWEIE